MAIKMFCNICDKFIKTLSPNEQVKGNEVCTDCKQRVDEVFKDMYELRGKAHKEITDLSVKVQQELTKIEKIHTKAQNRIDNVFNSTRLDLEEMTRTVVEGEKKQEVTK